MARIDAGVIAAENAARERGLRRDYAALGEQLDRRGIDIARVKAKVAAFGVAVPSWGVGTGGTRFARFPGTGEPRGHLRQARRLRGDPRADRRDADGVAAHPLGQGRPGGAAREGGGARARVRRDELEHLLGRARASALLQVRLALPHRRRGARAGGGAQPRMHRDRPGDRVEGADGLDRRRVELPRPGAFHPRLRALSRRDAHDLRRRCRRTGASSPSTRCTSRPSTRRWCRTGARTT